MTHWLVKEEPTHYSFERFVREGTTDWTGVHNPLAQRYLRAMRVTETGYYYHSGQVRAIVGTFSVARLPELDPSDARGAYRVRLRAGSALRYPVPLSVLKRDPRCRSFELVRIPRLSVMPVPDRIWMLIEKVSRVAPDR